MPQSLWDSLAISLLWMSRVGPYVALAVLFFAAVGLMILETEDIRALPKEGRVESIIAFGVLMPYTFVGALVDKGDNAIGPHQSWNGLQNLQQNWVSVNTVIACWALTITVIGLALYRLLHRQMQRAKLYTFVAVACLALSTRAMQLYTLQDSWAAMNLLAALVCIASIALPVRFAQTEWQKLTKQIAPPRL